MREAAESRWQGYRDAATEALIENRFGEAEGLYVSALQEAENLGSHTAYIPTNLHDLVQFYDQY
jgi:hypothetical protein